MENKKHSIDKVMVFLKKKEEQLIAELRSKDINKDEAFSFKVQISKAIECLEFCSKNGLVGCEREIIEIPEEASESYFTEYNLVDEAFSKSLNEDAIKKNSKGIIELNCFDLIIRKK